MWPVTDTKAGRKPGENIPTSFSFLFCFPPNGQSQLEWEGQAAWMMQFAEVDPPIQLPRTKLSKVENGSGVLMDSS